MMNRCFLFHFLLLSVVAIGPVDLRAEPTWFQEAKHIRKDADTVAPRSKTFEIVPDCELTEKSQKARATFTDAGERVIVRHAQIRVELPVRREKGDIVYKYRTRDVSYNGEPEWNGRWREPWTMGFFNYTVTVTYKGNVYTRQFKVGQEGLIPAIAPTIHRRIDATPSRSDR
jgi:hypothetical protein